MFVIAWIASVVLASSATPLFVPPAALHELKRDPGTADYMRRGGYTFVTEYRKTIHQRIGSAIIPRSILIVIATAPSDGFDAQGYAQARLMLANRHGLKTIASSAARLCRGQTGWLTTLSQPGSDTPVTTLFAASGETMYVAQLSLPKSVADSFGVLRSLYTLCPPEPAVSQTQGMQGPLPFTPPAGWQRGNVASAPTTATFQTAGVWLHVTNSAKASLESLFLVKAPALPQSMLAQDETEHQVENLKEQIPGVQVTQTVQKLCGGSSDGWLLTYTSGTFDVERMYAYGAAASYILTYNRRRGTAENPAARAAMNSLCAR
ncbi:MAG TPA: hypothetical protein VFO29_10575 [Candidatus Rubrimentiphilum sp.]|nr:hypothetical protein [Candidatus Rubrimentiphilum sp.]